MIMPDDIRARIRDLVWELADEIGWSELTDTDRAQYYELWTRDQRIGGRLAHFMDARKVRVYIKDSLVKPYERQRLSEAEQKVLGRLNIGTDRAAVDRFIKPHAVLLTGGELISWGKSRDWKLILMASFERAALDERVRSSAVMLLESGKTLEERARQLVSRAANHLRIDRIEWMD